MEKPFRNRTEAGRTLSHKLVDYAHRPDVLILALPRGGVPVASEIANSLGLDLDIFMVRPVHVPGQDRLVMGSIASGGVRSLNETLIRAFGIDKEKLESTMHREQRLLEDQEQRYRSKRSAQPITDRTILLVDDALANGSNIRAAVTAIRSHHPARIVVAVPLAAPEVCDPFRKTVDDIICCKVPNPFLASNIWYREFAEPTDEEICRLLERAHRARQVHRSAPKAA